ncbi:MAG TPA: hypothetical protein VMH86_07300 [Rhizomicrobium sp.]|nr:hypothetical protein [Rhizomicrobium sp.]
MSFRSEIARRPVLAGLFGLAGLGLAGGTAYEVAHIVRHRYPPTAFDDLLDRLPDRESAEKIGVVVIANSRMFDVASVARMLRRRIGRRPLADALAEDAAAGRLVEIGGWVMPETLTRLCGLAAS